MISILLDLLHVIILRKHTYFCHIVLAFLSLVCLYCQDSVNSKVYAGFTYIRHLTCHNDARYLFAVVCLLELFSLSALCSSLKGQAAAAASFDEGPALPTVKDVCAAYCSLAEIYLSDLWYGWRNTASMYEHC